MGKGALPTVGARRRTPHRGGTHTMKVPPLSERPDTEEEEQDFLTPPSRRKKRSLAVSGSPCWWLWQLLVPTRWARASARGTIAPAPPQHPPHTQHPCRQRPANLRCRAGTRSAPTESSYAPPSSRQTSTRSPNYPRKPRKTPNEAPKQPQNTTSHCWSTHGTPETHNHSRTCPPPHPSLHRITSQT